MAVAGWSGAGSQFVMPTAGLVGALDGCVGVLSGEEFVCSGCCHPCPVLWYILGEYVLPVYGIAGFSTSSPVMCCCT